MAPLGARPCAPVFGIAGVADVLVRMSVPLAGLASLLGEVALRTWLVPSLEKFASSLCSSAPLLGLMVVDFRTLVETAASQLASSLYEVSPLVLRHAGPSSGFPEKKRGPASTKARARWRWDLTVRPQVNARLSALPERVLRYLLRVVREVSAVLCGRSPSRARRCAREAL